MNLAKVLKNGGIGVMPTDTIYGLVGSAFSKSAVERIYKVRKRDLKKPFIILISSILELNKFGVKLKAQHRKILQKLWPGPVSVIFQCSSKKFKYLHRGTNALAFRLPDNKKLINFLKVSGPLVAPSANVSGKSSAKTIKEAQKYFGENVDFYIDGGKIEGVPSMILELKR